MSRRGVGVIKGVGVVRSHAASMFYMYRNALDLSRSSARVSDRQGLFECSEHATWREDAAPGRNSGLQATEAWFEASEENMSSGMSSQVLQL